MLTSFEWTSSAVAFLQGLYANEKRRVAVSKVFLAASPNTWFLSTTSHSPTITSPQLPNAFVSLHAFSKTDYALDVCWKLGKVLWYRSPTCFVSEFLGFSGLSTRKISVGLLGPLPFPKARKSVQESCASCPPIWSP